jgi:hypothetical protein
VGSGGVEGLSTEAARRLQEAVRRIEADRARRAKAAAIWRDDPRQIELRKDW